MEIIFWLFVFPLSLLPALQAARSSWPTGAAARPFLAQFDKSLLASRVTEGDRPGTRLGGCNAMEVVEAMPQPQAPWARTATAGGLGLRIMCALATLACHHGLHRRFLLAPCSLVSFLLPFSSLELPSFPIMPGNGRRSQAMRGAALRRVQSRRMDGVRQLHRPAADLAVQLAHQQCSRKWALIRPRHGLRLHVMLPGW